MAQQNVHQNVHQNESMADTIDEVWRIVPTLSDYATLCQAEKQQRRDAVAYRTRSPQRPKLWENIQDKATHYAFNNHFLDHLRAELSARINAVQQTTLWQAQPLSAAAPSFVPTMDVIHSVDPSTSSEESFQATIHQAIISPETEDAVPALSTIDLERASPSISIIRPTRGSSEQPSQIASRQATVGDDFHTNLGNMSENKRGKMRADHPMFAQQSRGTSSPSVATAASALNRSLFQEREVQSSGIPERKSPTYGPSTSARGSLAERNSSGRLYQERLEARQDITNMSAQRRRAASPTFGSRPSVMEASRALAEIPSDDPAYNRSFSTYTTRAMGNPSIPARATQASSSVTANRVSHTTAAPSHTSSKEGDHSYISMESQIEGYGGPRLPTYDEMISMPQSLNSEETSQAERQIAARKVRMRRFLFVADAVLASDCTRADVPESSSPAEDQLPPPTPPHSDPPSSSENESAPSRTPSRSESPSSSENGLVPSSTPTHSDSSSSSENEPEPSPTPSRSNPPSPAGEQSAPPPPAPTSPAWPAPPAELMAARRARAELVEAYEAHRTEQVLLAYGRTENARTDFSPAELEAISAILRRERHNFREELRNHDHTHSMRSQQNLKADIWGPWANRVTHSFNW